MRNGGKTVIIIPIVIGVFIVGVLAGLSFHKENSFSRNSAETTVFAYIEYQNDNNLREMEKMLLYGDEKAIVQRNPEKWIIQSYEEAGNMEGLTAGYIEKYGQPYDQKRIIVHYLGMKRLSEQVTPGTWEFILVQPKQGDEWIIVNQGE